MSDNPKPDDDPKIIIDDDWKSQVEKEKEDLKQPDDVESSFDEPISMPPASFVILLSTLATQAMASLGFISDPISGKPQVNRPMAKHFIDTLAMLQEKTKGNLDEEENGHLRDALHQLRMAYLSSESNPSTEPAPSGDSEPGDANPTIVLP